MRINLREGEGNQERQSPRRKKRRKKRRTERSRTFEAAIAQPQALPRQDRRKKQKTRRRRTQSTPQAGRGTEPSAPVARKRIPWRMMLVRLPALLILLGLAGLIGYASMDTQFFVYQASVRGAQHLQAHDIYQAAGIHEQSIFWIQPAKVAERIIQLDGIQEARVRTQLPAQVFIEVKERQPVVMWRARAQETDWWLDENGMVLPYPGDAQSPDMVFVVDRSDRLLHERGQLEPRGLVHSVLRLSEAVPGIQVFYYDADRGLSFTQSLVDGQWPVYVGTSKDLAHKIQVVQVLNSYLAANNIAPDYVDVRWPDHAVYAQAGRAIGAEGD